MNHRIKQKKLNRTTSHRKALAINMACAIIKHEQITTTLAKAKFIRPIVEKLVTKARKGSELHTKRQLISVLKDIKIVDKLTKLAEERYKSRPGGYLRIIKSLFRHGDNADLAIIEFVDRDPAAKGLEL